MTSLRRLLLGVILAPLAIGVAVSIALSYRDSLGETNELFDAKLAQTARVFRALAEGPLDQRSALPALAIEALDRDIEGKGEALAVADGHAYESKLAIQVIDPDGEIRLRSLSAPPGPLAPLEPGFSRHRLDGKRWRTFVLRADSGRWYLVGENEDIRDELAREIAIGTALPPLLALPLLVLLVSLLVGWALRALAEVAGELERRAARMLDPIDLRAVPREIGGLVEAINRLFRRVETALEREQRFTADAAHELRTPISALKLHAQNLAASADPAQRQASLDGLLHGIRRCERLVTQLLELARIERSGLQPAQEPVDLVALARQELAELAPRALQQRVEILLDASGPCMVAGDPFLIGMLLRNLVDNALRHGAQGGELTVTVEQRAQQVVLRVRDRGPGLAPGERERAFERFHRSPEARAEGSGLGLSIVARIAELHRATVELVDAAPGLLVELVFPARCGDQNSA